MNTRLTAVLILFLSINGYLFPQDSCFEHCWENLVAANRAFAKDEEFSFPYQRVMAYLEGCPMPPFSYKTIDNEQVSQEKLLGKVVVMNFWFQSCTPCLNELPGLNKLAETYKDSDVVFLAFGRDSEASIRSFLQRNSFLFKHVGNVFDNGALDCLCIMSGFPTTLVFDRQGKLVTSVRGGSVDPSCQFEIFSKLSPVINQHLRQTQ